MPDEKIFDEAGEPLVSRRPGRLYRDAGKDDDGVTCIVELSADEEAALEASQQEARSAGERFVSYLAFRERFTEAELEAIFAARKDDWKVDDFLSALAGNGGCDLNADLTKAGLAYLVLADLLEPERLDELLA